MPTYDYYQADEIEIDVKAIVRIMYKRRQWIFGVTCLAIVMTLVVMMLRPQQYEANSLVMLPVMQNKEEQEKLKRCLKEKRLRHQTSHS